MDQLLFPQEILIVFSQNDPWPCRSRSWPNLTQNGKNSILIDNAFVFFISFFLWISCYFPKRYQMYFGPNDPWPCRSRSWSNLTQSGKKSIFIDDTFFIDIIFFCGSAVISKRDIKCILPQMTLDPVGQGHDSIWPKMAKNQFWLIILFSYLYHFFLWISCYFPRRY